MMNQLVTLDYSDWGPQPGADDAARLTDALESGQVLFLPKLAFPLSEEERRFLSPRWSDGKAKNISYDPHCDALKGARIEEPDTAALKSTMARYTRSAQIIVERLCPHYRGRISVGRASLRVVEASGRRPRSVAKDDARLHIDAFASQPNQGRRILRVFCNVNPEGKPRVWRLGEPFDAVVARFCDRIPRQWPGSGWLLEHLGITRSRRTAYDHIMLGLHDSAKADDAYQHTSSSVEIEFPAGSTWMVYTDYVVHAALRGQYLLEQTFHLPVAAMRNEQHSPLRRLERLFRRDLA
jgi:hypothetical protein